MRNLAWILTVLIILFATSFLVEANTDLPDIDGWIVDKKTNIEVRVSSNIVIYLGFDTTYQNPNNLKEFVRVISRYIPGILEKPDSNDNKPDPRSFRQFIDNREVNRNEEDFFSNVESQSDPILYVRWKVTQDPIRGVPLQDGSIELWILQYNGDWAHTKGEKFHVEFLSEFIYGANKNILLGSIYSVGNVFHILRADRHILVTILKEKGEL